MKVIIFLYLLHLISCTSLSHPTFYTVWNVIKMSEVFCPISKGAILPVSEKEPEPELLYVFH